jgi:hypothetical protein
MCNRVRMVFVSSALNPDSIPEQTPISEWKNILTPICIRKLFAKCFCHIHLSNLDLERKFLYSRFSNLALFMEQSMHSNMLTMHSSLCHKWSRHFLLYRTLFALHPDGSNFIPAFLGFLFTSHQGLCGQVKMDQKSNTLRYTTFWYTAPFTSPAVPVEALC